MATIVGAPTGVNRLLDSVVRRERGPLAKMWREVELTFGETVSEPDEPIRHVYFPTTGYISLITPRGASESLEVGLVGSEGAFGITLLLGIHASPLKGLVQGGGLAVRMSAAHFRRALKESRTFERVMNSYMYVLTAQLAQTAACGRFHQLEPRLARWILMTHDRAGADTFRLTHEFLAQMLGVRRAGVTEAAGLIQKRKLIYYRRGVVRVLNRPGLEAIACACYKSFNDTYAKYLNGQPARRTPST